MSGFSSPPLLDPYSQQHQAPPFQAAQQAAYTAHSGHGSVGPVIGVLAVITILGAISVMIGRLCSGRRVMGSGIYDFEGWVESKCGACIDGRVDPPQPRILVEQNSSSQAATAALEQPEEEGRNEDARHEGVSDTHQHGRVKP